MMIANNKRRFWILATGAILVVAFVLIRYIPLRREMGDLRERLENLEVSIEKAAACESEIALLQAQIEASQKRFDKYGKSIPEDRDLGVFLESLTGLMKKHGLREQTIRPEAEIVSETLRCIPIRMHCSGELQDMFRFFRSLDDLDRAIRVEQVKITNDRDYSGWVTMETSAVIYYKAVKEG